MKLYGNNLGLLHQDWKILFCKMTTLGHLCHTCEWVNCTRLYESKVVIVNLVSMCDSKLKP